MAEANAHIDGDILQAEDAMTVRSGSRIGVEDFSKNSSPSQPRFDVASHAESFGALRASQSTSLANHDLCREIVSGVLEGINRNAFWDRHTDMLETINRVMGANTDFTPVIQSIGRGLRERQSELVEAITNITVEPPDLRPILAAVEDLNSQLRHSEVLEAVQVLKEVQPDLTPVQTATSELRSDLQTILAELRRDIAVGFEELRQVADLRRDLAAGFEELRQDLASLRREVSEGRKEARADSDVSIAELRALPQVLGDMTQILRKLDLQTDNSEVLRAVQEVDVKPDLRQIAEAVHERFLTTGRLHVDHDDVLRALRQMGETMHERFRATDALHVESAEMVRQALRRADPEHHAIANLVVDKLQKVVNHDEILRHLQRIPDHDVLLRAVEEQMQRFREVDIGPLHESVRRMDFTVDHSIVLEAIRGIQTTDHDTLATAVHERMSGHTFSVDLSSVHESIISSGGMMDSLDKAIRGIRMPDHEAIASAVMTRLRDQIPKVDNDVITNSVCERLQSQLRESNAAFHEVLERRLDQTTVLEALRRIHIPDHETIANALHDRMRLHTFNVDHSEVIKAIRSMEIDLAPVHDAIGRINIDHTPIFDAIRRINTPDTQQIANAVHEKLRKHVFSVDQGDVLRAISKIKLEPDLTPLLRAISAAEVDLSPVLDAVSKIHVHVDHAPVVEAVKRINMPDVHTLATIISDKLRKTALNAEGDVIEEIRRLRVDPDLTPVMSALNSLVADVSSLAEAMGRIHRMIDYTPLLDAVKRISVPDTLTLTSTVVDQVRRSIATRDDEMMHEIRATRVDPDLGPLIQAINSAEVDLSPVLDSITSLGSVVLGLKEQIRAFSGTMSSAHAHSRIVETVVPQVIETVVPQVIETVQTIQPQVVERVVDSVMPYNRGTSTLVTSDSHRNIRSTSPMPVSRVITPRMQQRQVSVVHQRGLSEASHRELSHRELGVPRPVETVGMPVGYTTPPNPVVVPAETLSVPVVGTTPALSQPSYAPVEYCGTRNGQSSPMLSPTPSMTSIPLASQAILSGMEHTYQEGMEMFSPDKRSRAASRGPAPWALPNGFS